MNKEDEMIEKSISQMGYYLKLNDYVIEPISKKKYDDLKKGYNEIKVFYHKKELIDKHPKVYLFYSYESFNKNTLDKIISNIHLEERDTLLIITKDYASTINKYLRTRWYHLYINIFKINQLQYNILEHSFVPKHIKLSLLEKEELYLKYNIENDKQLPQISIFDPVAKVILLRPGEVCKIIRYDKISLKNDYYRICVG